MENFLQKHWQKRESLPKAIPKIRLFHTGHKEFYNFNRPQVLSAICCILLNLLGITNELLAQVTNGNINYEIRIKEIRQFYDNDYATDDDNVFKIAVEDPAWTNNFPNVWGTGDINCGASWWLYYWQQDAPSSRNPSYYGPTYYEKFLYRTNQIDHNSVIFHVRSWEEDGSWSCSEQEGNNDGEWAGWDEYAFKGAQANTGGLKSSEWRDIGWIANGWTVTYNEGYGRQGDAQFRSTWRYTNGGGCSSPLDFGTLALNSTKTHINSNRVKPTNAENAMGYTNQLGNTAPDVFYQFTLTNTTTVTVSTSNSTTNYDTNLRLYDASCGTQISNDDDSGIGTTSQITNEPLCPGTYRVVVEGYGANTGDFQLSVSTGADATIGNPSVFGNNEWNVYGYNGKDYNLGGGVSYQGFYTDNTLNFNSVLDWPILGSPSDASNYQGCTVNNDSYTVRAKRKGFTCGEYRVDVYAHDDEMKIIVDGATVFDHSVCCDTHIGANAAWTGVLDANSEVEIRWADGTGASEANVTFTNLANLQAGTIEGDQVICSGGNPTVFSNVTASSGAAGNLT